MIVCGMLSADDWRTWRTMRLEALREAPYPVSVAEPVPQHSAELISMWVAPFARGRGVGDALVEAALEWRRSVRMTQLRLAVVRTNSKAVALYRRHGFAPAEIENGELQMTLVISRER